MGWLNRIAAIIGCRKLERDLDDEIELHIEFKTQENMASGMPHFTFTPNEVKALRSYLDSLR